MKVSNCAAILQSASKEKSSRQRPRARPNPSIEGTCNIRLRLLSHAPHVKR